MVQEVLLQLQVDMFLLDTMQETLPLQAEQIIFVLVMG